MIPNPEERQYRPCEECIFYREEDLCRLFEDGSMSEKIERWVNEEFDLACPYHFTADEIMELIDISVKPDLNDGPGIIWRAE